MSHRWLYSSHHGRRQHLLRSRSPVKIPPEPFLNIDPCQLFHPSTTWRLVVHQLALNDQRRICHTYDMGEKRSRVQQSKIPGGVGGPGACAAVRNASGLLLSALQAPLLLLLHPQLLRAGQNANSLIRQSFIALSKVPLKACRACGGGLVILCLVRRTVTPNTTWNNESF